jgi:membrane protein
MRVMRLHKFGGESEHRSKAIQGKASPWHLGGLTYWQLLKRLYHEMDDDDVLTRSAALAYYFILALVPMIFFLTAILGFFARSHDLQSDLLHYTSRLMPGDTYRLIRKSLQEITQNSSGFKLALGLMLALWSGSGGISSIMDALNRCYGINELRPWWKRRLAAVGLTIAISALTIVALLIILYGGNIVDFIGSYVGLSAAAVMIWHFAQWPIALLFVVTSFALLYYWGPDSKQTWQWITPGSLVGVLVWIGVSMMFRVYLHYFNTYSKTYGALGAVIVLLFWLYISGFAILLGGEINSEIANASLGRPDAKEVGEKKKLGERVA